MPTGRQGLWQTLAQLAAWLAGLVAPFVAPPPPLSPAIEGENWDPFTQFIIAFVIGVIWLILRIPKARNWLYVAIAVIMLIAGLASLAEYRKKSLSWSCEYANRGRVMVGETLLPEAKEYSERMRSTCSDLVQDSGGATERVWPRDQLIERYERLGWLYTLTVVLLTTAVFLLLEASRRRRVSPGPP